MFEEEDDEDDERMETDVRRKINKRIIPLKDMSANETTLHPSQNKRKIIIGHSTAFNAEHWLTLNSKLYRAPKISSEKPVKWKNQWSNLYKK